MPRGDGTGPAGMGPMSGRAAGLCAGYPVPGYMNPVGGRGFWGWGRGRGGGRGRRNWFWATGVPRSAMAGFGWPASGAPVAPFAPAMTPAPQQELEALKQEASYFQDALKDIQERIDELQSAAAAKE